MYIVMTSIRSILKNMRLFANLWNLINEVVIYTKNRTITFNESNKISMIFYKKANKTRSNVSNLRALNCKAYTHISKTTNRKKFNDRFWKNIHVEYEDLNQWKIYNSRIRRVHFIKNVKFDENYNYYEKNYSLFAFYQKFNDEFDLNEFWNSFENDDDFDEESRCRQSDETNKNVLLKKNDEKNVFIKTFENQIIKNEIYVDRNIANLNDSNLIELSNVF